jgi:DNA-binding NtrC family response regulator
MTCVLVLDDEDVVRELMVEILVRAGYEVRAEAAPEHALELVENREIDLVVTDLVMPSLSGLDVLERIKEARPELPVVVVTGVGTDENLARAEMLGAASVIIKPFTHAQLRDAVAAALAP